MKRGLISIEKKGITALNKGDFKSAVEYFSKICAEQPDFEHGMCFYHIACAYEELGNSDLARVNFENSLKYDSGDYIRLGGYASFLYLHDAPEKAFNIYLKLLKIEVTENKEDYVNNTIIALKELGKKIGLSEADVMQQVESIKNGTEPVG